MKVGNDRVERWPNRITQESLINIRPIQVDIAARDVYGSLSIKCFFIIYFYSIYIFIAMFSTAKLFPIIKLLKGFIHVTTFKYVKYLC